MSTSVSIYPLNRGPSPASDPLPRLIQTPSGLALLELQGTINLPHTPTGEDFEGTREISIGRIAFPEYDAATDDEGSTAWMKGVHMYVGQHQRLPGEVKKLPRAVAVVRRRTGQEPATSEGQAEELEIIEIVKYKLVFSQRPEPVDAATASLATMPS